METPFGKFMICVLLYAQLREVTALNVDFTMETAKIMMSPTLSSLGKKVPGSSLRKLDPSTPSSFYGEAMKIMSSPPRLIVGAPRTTDPDNPKKQTAPTKPSEGKRSKKKPKGLINFCPVSTHNNSIVPECTSVGPEPRKGDGMGSSISARPDGAMTACSPFRVQKCTVGEFSPGYCFKSEDNGTTWSKKTEPPAPGCPKTVDVLFVLDGSGSVSGSFDKVKDWVKNISKAIKPQLESGIVQIGVVQYSHYFPRMPLDKQNFIKTEIELGYYNTFDELAEAIDNIAHHNYTTHTGHALEKVRDDFNNSLRFGNEENEKQMFLMTDGKSNDSELILPNANYLRDKMGVKTYAVGVANAVQKELGQIATGDANSTERVYSVNNFDQLGSLVKGLQEQILEFALEGSVSSSVVNYNFEYGQTGFSTSYTKRHLNQSSLDDEHRNR